MRQVLINGRFLGQRVTGVQRFARELLRHMDAVLFEQTALQKRLDLAVLTPIGTPNALDLKAIRVRHSGRFRGHVWEQVELARSAGSQLLVNLCNTAPLAGRNMITTVHDASVFVVPETYSRAFGGWYRVLIPAVARRSRRVITVSQFSRNELVRHARIPPHTIAVISGSGEHILVLPPEERIIQRLGLRRRGYILAVNSHSLHKNVAGFALAAKLLDRAEYDVVLAGGVDKRVFRERSSLPEGRLRMTGYVSDAELRALYENAACFVYPSFYEGFGLPPLEAMACGCPVVVSRAASLPEVCGDAAVYCDPRDPADIARAMEQVLADSAAQEDLRRRSLERARSFSWKRSACAMLDHIEDLLG
ncbi:MAG TPA: glycosyltransferase family 1 protein [Gemmatimonadales bacterium]|nr:glycosyltransferase family 1 protein [Gemmatimonadales bacterium]